MPKTDVKKIESEDLKELSDETLDRVTGGVQACPATVVCYMCSSPAE
ncbi:MAG: hypothetical protein ISR48_00020 [Alphaproteobacteria bacterium]|nr:hypothetical protein [Alphaproteobacteria bacterium]